MSFEVKYIEVYATEAQFTTDLPNLETGFVTYTEED